MSAKLLPVIRADKSADDAPALLRPHPDGHWRQLGSSEMRQPHPSQSTLPPPLPYHRPSTAGPGPIRASRSGGRLQDGGQVRRRLVRPARFLRHNRRAPRSREADRRLHGVPRGDYLLVRHRHRRLGHPGMRQPQGRSLPLDLPTWSVDCAYMYSADKKTLPVGLTSRCMLRVARCVEDCYILSDRRVGFHGHPGTARYSRGILSRGRYVVLEPRLVNRRQLS